jgi:hypothetical protein
MNPNDYLAQLQAQQQAILQSGQHVQFIMLLISIAGIIGTAWALFMFYARLRDIADELQKLRIAYMMAEDRKAHAAGSPRTQTSPVSAPRS